MSNFIMGPDYFRPGGQWAQGDDEIGRRYQQEHSFDPSTGDLLGPLGPVPHHLGLRYQSVHNQLVWRARNRMAQDAVRSMQGAAGTLSSFRQGGGAALESGVFGQVAGLQMQRASMLQPMDLLGDYRRHETHKARSGGSGDKWASIGGAVLSTVGTAVSAAGYPYIGVPLSAAGGALSGYGAGSGQGYYPQQGGGARQAGAGQPGGFGGAQQGGGAAMGAQNAQGETMLGPGWGQPNPSQGPGLVGGPNAPGAPTPPVGIAAPEGGGTAQAGMQAPGGAGAAPPAQGGEQAQGEPGAPGGPDGGFAAGGYVATGAGDGMMTPAARVAKRYQQTPYAREIDTVVSEYLVEEVTQDPTYDMLTAMFDREIGLRMGAA